MTTTWLAGVVLAACQGLAAQAPSERAPVPLAEVSGGIQFTEVRGPLTWLRKPVGAADRVSFTTSRVCANQDDACSDVVHSAKKDVRDVLFEHLLPVLGQKDTLAVLEPLIAETVLVSAEVGTVRLPAGTADQDRSEAACLGWRAPLRSIVAKFPPREQGRIEWALIRPIVNWRRVDKAPPWVTRLPQRVGYVRCAFAHTKKRVAISRASAISAANRDVHAHIAKLLAPAVGKERADKAARAGVRRIGAVARVFTDSRNPKTGLREQQTAYCLWEVPIAPMLLELPEGLRKVAEYQLQQQEVVELR